MIYSTPYNFIVSMRMVKKIEKAKTLFYVIKRITIKLKIFLQKINFKFWLVLKHNFINKILNFVVI